MITIFCNYPHTPVFPLPRHVVPLYVRTERRPAESARQKLYSMLSVDQAYLIILSRLSNQGFLYVCIMSPKSGHS